MSADDKRQRVSALADGDLSDMDSSQTIRHLTEDPGLRGVWERYHLIGDAIRGEATRFQRRSVAEEVSRRLAAEPTVLVPERRHRPKAAHWARPAAGGALAAGVAILAVLGVPRFVGPEGPGGSSVAVNLPSAQSRADGGTRWRHVDPAVEAKLNRLLVDHGEYVAPASVPRALPYASFVSYDEGR